MSDFVQGGVVVLIPVAMVTGVAFSLLVSSVILSESTVM